MNDTASLQISVGSRLYTAATPNLAVGALLPQGEFGRRQLHKQIISKEEKQGEELQAAFGMGPFAHQLFDLDKPRAVEVIDPTRANMVLGELVWEVVRLREFSHRPSRLDCMFFWASQSKAKDWFAHRTWPSALYEVEVVECQRYFIADLNKVQFRSEDGTVATMMNQARSYWSTPGEPASSPEVLLEGTARIVSTITEERP